MSRVALVGLDDTDGALLISVAREAGLEAEPHEAAAVLRGFGGYRMIILGRARPALDDDEPSAVARALRARGYDGALLYLAPAEEAAGGSAIARELTPCVERSPLTPDGLLRIAGWMRRVGRSVAGGGGLRLSDDGATVVVDGDERVVGGRGYRLLEYLLARAGTRCTHAELGREVYRATVAEVTIRADVSRLRRALGAEYGGALRAVRGSSSRAGATCSSDATTQSNDRATLEFAPRRYRRDRMATRACLRSNDRTRSGTIASGLTVRCAAAARRDGPWRGRHA